MRTRRMMIMVAAIAATVIGGLQARADDTEIFGQVINLPPNVLIIFDNSGSMAEEVEVITASEPYNPSTAYSGSYSRSRVYYYRSAYNDWRSFANIGSNYYVDASEIACAVARDALNTKGTWTGYISTNSPFPCGTTERILRTGNYLNYLASKAVVQRRQKIAIAKETISNLISEVSGVRFGVMVFNNNEGGHVLAPVADRETSTAKQALIDQINALTASTWTPLAETLAEAGLYFARKQSWFNSGVNYATAYPPAIQYRCQKNYIIIMTDGESTQDRNSNLWTTPYINDKVIGDYDHDSAVHDEYHYVSASGTLIAYQDNGSDYLDDVAAFLHKEDLLGDIDDEAGISFNDPGYSLQNVSIYTIGFDIDHKLLSETADQDHGGGRYYTTNDSSIGNLGDIFIKIISNILERNSQFISPIVPVSRLNRTFAGNALYMGLFTPDEEHPGLWKGNLKKFGFDSEGHVLDKYGANALNTAGAISDDAHSAWSSLATGSKEGVKVDVGGAGSVILSQASRTFKTDKSNTIVDLTSANVSAADLGVDSDAKRDDLLDFVKAAGVYNPDTGSDIYKRQWVLGDIVHSQPAVLHDSANNRNVIFVGANDGFLHCLVDADNGTPELTDDTLSEAWAYVPGSILANLKYLPSEGMTSQTGLGDTNHDYYVDGSPEVYKIGSNRYLAFGLRRGGKDLDTGGEVQKQYYILNITNYMSPSLAATVSKDILGTGTGDEKLGQSWFTPLYTKIKTGPSGTQNVLLLTGGYDTNQDNGDPGSSDTKGRAVFAVDAASGALVANLNFNRKNFSHMNYCIVDLKAYDNDDDNCTDVIYAPSAGGELFLFDDAHQNLGTVNDGTWTGRVLFKASPMGSTERLRKFLYAPGVAQEVWGDWVYIASGDREHPTAMTGPSYGGYNRFYAIRNTFPATWNNSTPLTDSDLTDLSANPFQGTLSTPSSLTEEQKISLRENLIHSGNGWFFDLEHPGEKAVSTPLVYKGVVYFTTFTPGREISSTDPCGSAGGGVARLYAVNADTGEAVYKNFDGNASQLTNEDRSTVIGSGIPSQPTLVVTEKSTFLLVGTEGGGLGGGNDQRTRDIDEGAKLTPYFWMKVN